MIHTTILQQLAQMMLDTSAKALIVLALAWMVTRALRRAPAAARHLAWTLAAAVIVLLPLVSPLLPAVKLHVVDYEPAPKPAPLPPSPIPSLDRWPIGEIPQLAPANAKIAVKPTPKVASTAAQYSHWSAHTWLAVAIGVWLGGAGIVMLPWALGAVAMCWIGRKARPAPEGTLRETFVCLCHELQIRQTVLLLVSRDSIMPIAWGAFRSRVLLPADATRWPADRLRCVLLHELAHVKRRDCATQLLAQLAAAMHWFNPLAWVMVRQMRGERERASDDVVLDFEQRRQRRGNEAGAAASYAEHLVQIARSLPSPPRLSRVAAVAMARGPSQLRGRVLAILDPSTSRRALSRRIALLALLIASAILLPLAALRVAAASVPKELSDWARQRGFNAEAIEKTTLESRLGGWRNLPFEISREEEDDVKQCIKLAREIHSTIDGRSEFDSADTRDSLAGVLKRRPEFFYAEFLMSVWKARNGGTPKEVQEWLEAAYAHAPAIIVQRFETPDGHAAANLRLQSFALECNRVKGGSLDPSLKLYYPEQTTDAAGCIYLPTYKTVFRTDDMSWPEGHNVKYPTLGWFESPAKVGMLPIAVVTLKGGATAPAATQSAKPSVLLVTEGNFYLERVIDAMELPRHAQYLPEKYDKDGPGDFNVVIFDRIAPAKLPPHCIIFGAAPTDGPIKVKDGLLRPLTVVGMKQQEHPILRDIELNTLHTDAALDLNVTTPPATVLAKTNDHPLIVVSEEPNGQRMIVVGFDILQSNWPTKVSFPVFVSRAVDYLANGALADASREAPEDAEIAAISKRRAELAAAVEQFRKEHPNQGRDETLRELTLFSQDLTRAQLELIEIQSSHGAEHPDVAAAREKMETLRQRYEKKLEEATRLNQESAEYSALTAELGKLAAKELRLRTRANAPASNPLDATLTEQLAEEDEKIATMETQMADFQKEHPNLKIDFVMTQQLAELSRAYTQAQLATIEAKERFPESHPALRKARAREEELHTIYRDMLQQVLQTNVAAADYTKLASEVAQKRMFAKQLQERIEQLRAATPETPAAPAAEPSAPAPPANPAPVAPAAPTAAPPAAPVPARPAAIAPPDTAAQRRMRLKQLAADRDSIKISLAAGSSSLGKEHPRMKELRARLERIESEYQVLQRQLAEDERGADPAAPAAGPAVLPPPATAPAPAAKPSTW